MDRAQKLLEIKTNLIEMRSTLSRCIDHATEHKEGLTDDDVDRFHSASENLRDAIKQLEVGARVAKTNLDNKQANRVA